MAVPKAKDSRFARASTTSSLQRKKQKTDFGFFSHFVVGFGAFGGLCCQALLSYKLMFLGTLHDGQKRLVIVSVCSPQIL